MEKSKAILGILLSFIIAFSLSFNYLLFDPSIHLRVFAIGTPDSYGNVIMNLTIHQWNGSLWIQRLFWDNDTNWDCLIEPEYPINITLWVRLNNTLASDLSEAISYTQVKCNITDGGTIWNNVEFNNTDSGSNGNYYYCQEQGHWNQTNKPESGIDYEVSTKFQAFY